MAKGKNLNGDDPGWAQAAWRQLNGATKVVGAITAFVLALLGLWAVIPKPDPKPDCTTYAQLTPEEQETCDMQ